MPDQGDEIKGPGRGQVKAVESKVRTWTWPSQHDGKKSWDLDAARSLASEVEKKSDMSGSTCHILIEPPRSPE